MGDTKRRTLTPEERIAKAKATLDALEAKARAADVKRYDELHVQRAKLVEQIEERQTKLDGIDAELVIIVERTPDLAVSKPSLTVVEDDEAAAV
jgi:hypothetical protein